MPTIDNSENLRAFYANMNAVPFDALRDIMRDSSGAMSDEELNKVMEFHQQMTQRGFNNLKLVWQTMPDGSRKLVSRLKLYSQDRTEVWEDKVPNNESDLEERGLVMDYDGDVDEEDMVGVCDCCGKKYCVDKLTNLEDCEDMYCNDCLNENAHRCERCGRWFTSSEYFEEVYRDYDNYEGYWCEVCQRETNCEWNEDDERMYINRGDNRMQKFLKPDGLLAKGRLDCPDCMDSDEGWCPRHLKEKIKEMEDEATTLWVYDTERRNYHEAGHNRFKKLKYRMKHEHPLLFYGIELEVLWDRNKGTYERVVKEFIEATGGLFVAEYDRSVDDRGNMLGHYIGAEFISRPTSYKRWIDKDTITKLDNGMKVLKKYGAINPMDDGCGLHVHMSKAFFENKTKKKVSDIKSDMDWFFQYFQPEIEKISRRPYGQYCASKAFRLQNSSNDFRNNNTMFGIKGKFVMEKGKLTVSQGSGITHHDCVIETPKTIEARTFRSTIETNEILATIEFCRGLAHAARNRVGLTGKTFGDIMFTKESPYLLQYVQKMKLDTSRQLKTKLEVKI